MKKFAIYKSPTGYYYHRYFDSLEQLCGTNLENLVSEDKLPVVSDDCGGYYRFEKDYRFVEIVETDKECPLTLEKMFFKNHEGFKLGWISPDGDTYSCDFTNHTKLAKMLAEKFFPDAKLPERALGKAGWIKVIDSWDGIKREHGQFVYSISGKITNRQINKLFDLGLYDNPEVKELIKNND